MLWIMMKYFHLSDCSFSVCEWLKHSWLTSSSENGMSKIVTVPLRYSHSIRTLRYFWYKNSLHPSAVLLNSTRILINWIIMEKSIPDYRPHAFLYIKLNHIGFLWKTPWTNQCLWRANSDMIKIIIRIDGNRFLQVLENFQRALNGSKWLS